MNFNDDILSDNTLKMDVLTGNLKVLSSGVVMSAGINESILFDIKNNVNLKLEFRFSDIDNNNDNIVNVEFEEDKLIIILDKNKKQISTKIPVKITKNDGSENFYVSFSIFKSSDKAAHKLEYTFYIG